MTDVTPEQRVMWWAARTPKGLAEKKNYNDLFYATENNERSRGNGNNVIPINRFHSFFFPFPWLIPVSSFNVWNTNVSKGGIL